MNSSQTNKQLKEKGAMLSTLWVFASLNYIYADVFTLIFNLDTREMAMKMTKGAVLGWAIMMETALAMIIFSRVFKYRANRWLNIIIGVLHTAAVSWSLFQGKPDPYYLFFALIEISCTLFIIWYAWRWKPEREMGAN